MPDLRRYAPVPLRLILGTGLLVHGIPKFGGRHAMFAGLLQSIGVPVPEAASWLIAGLEVGGAVLILGGVLVTPVAIAIIVEMIVAIVTVHWDAGFNFIRVIGRSPEGRAVYGFPGYEPNLFYIAALVSLILSGPGPWAVRWRRSAASEDAAAPGPAPVR